jgi:hypothetical protein
MPGGGELERVSETLGEIELPNRNCCIVLGSAPPILTPSPSGIALARDTLLASKSLELGAILDSSFTATHVRSRCGFEGVSCRVGDSVVLLVEPTALDPRLLLPSCLLLLAELSRGGTMPGKPSGDSPARLMGVGVGSTDTTDLIGKTRS